MEIIKNKNITEKEKHSRNVLDDPFERLHVWRTGEIKILKDQGISSLTGYWRPHEIKQLESNMNRFQVENPDVDILNVLYGIRKKDKMKILKNKDFIHKMAYGIQRDLNRISMKVREHYKSYYGFKTGPLTKHEWQLLRKLAKKHNKDWYLISKEMNRFSGQLATKYSQVFDQEYINCIKKLGPWSNEETQKLYQIVSKMPVNKIEWKAVAGYVGARPSKNCRNKWISLMKQQKCFNKGNGLVTLKEKALIIFLYHSNYNEEKHFDYSEIISLFTYEWDKEKVITIWENLKRLVSPLESRQNFRCSLKDLYERYCIKDDLIKPKINFKNVAKSMKYKKSNYWLRAKFLLLRNEIPGNETMSTEEIILALEKNNFDIHKNMNYFVGDDEGTYIISDREDSGNDVNQSSYESVLIKSDSDNFINYHGASICSFNTSISSNYRKLSKARKVCDLVCTNPVTSSNNTGSNRTTDRTSGDSNVKRKKCEFLDLTLKENDFHAVLIDD